MTQASMPKVNVDSEGDGCGGGGADVHGIELIGAVISVEYHPGASFLDRKTTFVKLNGNRMFTSNSTNRT